MSFWQWVIMILIIAVPVLVIASVIYARHVYKVAAEFLATTRERGDVIEITRRARGTVAKYLRRSVVLDVHGNPKYDTMVHLNLRPNTKREVAIYFLSKHYDNSTPIMETIE